MKRVLKRLIPFALALAVTVSLGVFAHA